jgi:hypothetical protein
MSFREKLQTCFSDADPGCLSRILIFVHPGSRIQYPKMKTAKKGGVKKFVVLPVGTFFFSLKYHKIENYFIFELAKKKIWANLLYKEL